MPVLTGGASGVGPVVPAPDGHDAHRRHMRLMHAVHLEAWVPLDGVGGAVQAHEAAHGCLAEVHSMTVEQREGLPSHQSGRCWHDDIPHRHAPPEPPPPPEPDRVWW